MILSGAITAFYRVTRVTSKGNPIGFSFRGTGRVRGTLYPDKVTRECSPKNVLQRMLLENVLQRMLPENVNQRMLTKEC